MSDSDDGVPLARVISYDVFTGQWRESELPNVRAWARATDWSVALSTCPDARWLLSIANDLFRRKALSRRDFVRCVSEALATFSAVCPAAMRVEADLREANTAWSRGDADEFVVRTMLERTRWANALRIVQESVARMILADDIDVGASIERVVYMLPFDYGHSPQDAVFAREILNRATRASFAPVLAQALETAPRCPQHLSLEARA